MCTQIFVCAKLGSCILMFRFQARFSNLFSVLLSKFSVPAIQKFFAYKEQHCAFSIYDNTT